MKNILLWGLLVVWAGVFHSCSEDNIASFHGKHQIYFNKFYMDALSPGVEEADSTVESFMSYAEGTQQIQAKLVVNLSGTVPEKDIPFGLKVVDEGTTAEPSEYQLADQYVFHARRPEAGAVDLRDTIEVTINRSERLDVLGEKGVRLVVELVPNEQVDLGQFERRRAVLVWSLYPTMPSWWDKNTDIGEEVIYTLLGDYASDKYVLFLQHGDPDREMSEDLIKNNPSRAIELVSNFKSWLIENQNDPVNGERYKEILSELKV